MLVLLRATYLINKQTVHENVYERFSIAKNRVINLPAVFSMMNGAEFSAVSNY